MAHSPARKGREHGKGWLLSLHKRKGRCRRGYFSTRRSPRKHTLHEMGTPSSLNIRPQKKLVGSRECGVETEDVAKGEAQEVFEDLPKQEEAANIQEPKVYLEIELPDGRLARQCHASADCPKRSAFILKRTDDDVSPQDFPWNHCRD
ncbi:hypothetical protein GOP47_0030520 [Adiantum capillus-veneris]|nr:hypothetical protein GOP47_0030520 [Adiantum capillus-veneris]